MRDQAFARLLTTLDTVPAGPAAIPGDASGDFAEAQLRLRATQRRLGACVQESPYLAFAKMCRKRIASHRAIAIVTAFSP